MTMSSPYARAERHRSPSSSDTKDDVQVDAVYCEIGTVKYRTEIESDDHGGQRPTILSDTRARRRRAPVTTTAVIGADDGTGHH